MGNTSPRHIIRQEIIGALREVIPGDCPILDSFARDVPADLDRFISVYAPLETMTRTPGRGEGRTGRPVERRVYVDILICAQAAGDGAEAADEADALSRIVEMKINESFTTMEPTQALVDFSADEVISCLIRLSYVISYLDKMDSDAGE